MQEEIEEKRFRNYMILLYPDDDEFEHQLSLIRGLFNKWCYIIHEPEDSEKKQHVHCLVFLDNPTTKTKFCEKIEVKERLVDVVHNKRLSIRYLTHIDSDKKILYSLDELNYSNAIKSEVLNAYQDTVGDEQILNAIYKFIDDTVDCNNLEFLQSFNKFIIRMNCYKLYNRYKDLFKDYRRELINEEYGKGANK